MIGSMTKVELITDKNETYEKITSLVLKKWT